MNDARFDAISRSLVPTRTRRALARAAAGGLLAALGRADGAVAGKRKVGADCTKNKQCRSRRCGCRQDPTFGCFCRIHRCEADFATCTVDEQCCRGLCVDNGSFGRRCNFV
jgi:hypothetical protein